MMNYKYDGSGLPVHTAQLRSSMYHLCVGGLVRGLFVNKRQGPKAHQAQPRFLSLAGLQLSSCTLVALVALHEVEEVSGPVAPIGIELFSYIKEN